MPVVSFVDTKRAVKIDLTAEAGTDLEVPITIQDLNVTGYTAKLQVRKYKDADEVLFEMSTENGKIETTSGTVKLIFAQADFVGATWDAGVYDLEITSSASKCTRIMEGNFYIDPEVTR
jgi:hypothetical protein